MDNKYKLDPDLDAVLREQMIEGGVPEEEVQPSIDDIEEAMDKRTGAKIEWGNQYERLSDRRLRGKLSKQPDGQWLIVVITDTTFGNGPNLRVPESGEEVIAPVRGEDHSFILLDRVYPELPGIDTSEPPHSNNYSYWTFKGAPAQERTAAKIEWNTPFERYSDPRLIGGFNKQDDGSWLIQVSINNRGGNTRFPEPGDEVIVPVKGEDHSFRVLERVYPKDESYRVDDDLYSWWTFEAIPDNIEENANITNMEDNTKTGADILNTPSETPRFDVPFEQPEEAPVESEYTDEEYASVPQEVNDQIINLIREMRAAGTPMPEIMRHAREIIEAWISSNRHSASSVEIERTTMPLEHLGWYEKVASGLESSYYTVRLTGEQMAIIKGGLRVLAGQIGGAEAAQIQNALEALETAAYDVSGSGLGDIPTLPEEPER